MKMARRGFTLVELIVFAAIFTVAMIGFITMFIAATRVQSRQSSSNEVETQGQFLLQQVQYYVQSARLVDMPLDASATTLKLREANSSLDPTFITLTAGTVYLTQGQNGVPQPLTSGKVVVSSISFTRHYNLNTSSTPYGTDSVSYAFTMAANTSSSVQQYTQSFQSSAATLAPVPKVALVQQSSTTNANTGITSIAAQYAYANATGSLLVAVVANVNAVTVTLSSDSAGNAWSKVGSASYPADSEQINIFAALNAKNSSDTVTVNFGGGGATNPSLFIYEYRGAATSSSFDASSTQVQTSTMSFSSGKASATSSVELAFGALYLSPLPPSAPAAGSGFTIESSSSVSNVFIEDKDLYVTGSVCATWTTTQTASSSAIVATFK